MKIEYQLNCFFKVTSLKSESRIEEAFDRGLQTVAGCVRQAIGVVEH